jgi:hypothetical protein
VQIPGVGGLKAKRPSQRVVNYHYQRFLKLGGQGDGFTGSADYGKLQGCLWAEDH